MLRSSFYSLDFVFPMCIFYIWILVIMTDFLNLLKQNTLKFWYQTTPENHNWEGKKYLCSFEKKKILVKDQFSQHCNLYVQIRVITIFSQHLVGL